jgi:hypothetical protein
MEAETAAAAVCQRQQEAVKARPNAKAANEADVTAVEKKALSKQAEPAAA